MAQYIIRRLLWSIPVIFGITLTVFIIGRIMPGGPFDAEGDRVLPEEVAKVLQAKYHLDWPIWKQFVSYVIGDELLDPNGTSKGIIRGDLGPSYRFRGYKVHEMVADTLPVSVQLGILAMLIGVTLGVPLGIIAAMNHNRMLDYVATLIAVVGVSVPNLVWGPVLVWIFAIQLGWFPAARWGAEPPFFLGWIPPMTAQFGSHAFLPSLAIGTHLSASIARLTRASLLQVLREDYIRTARAKGLKEHAIIIAHALRNSLIPVVTILGPMAAAVLTGMFVVERIFGIPGMGQYFVNGIANRDYPVITGVTLIYSVFLVISNLIVDVVYAFLDPRIRYD